MCTVTGYTTSSNFPVTVGAFQQSSIPAQCGFVPGKRLSWLADSLPPGFAAKIDPSGTRLVYATYLGGEQEDDAKAIAVDDSGNAYITGSTSSMAFPVTPGAWQTGLGSELFNGFITKLNAAGSGLVFSTYLPGGEGDAVAVDGAGDVFVAGTASGATFPATPGAFQTIASWGMRTPLF